MMKEILIIIISILLVIVGSNISQGYLNKTSDELIQNIDILREEIKKAQNSEDNISKELSEDIYNKWQEIEKNWSIIVIHNELDLIELALVSMKTCIEENEYSEAIKELEKSSYLLEHIKDNEKLELKNIL